MSGRHTDLKAALQQSVGKLPAAERGVSEEASTAAAGPQSASRLGKKAVTVYYSKAAHQQLKHLAVDRETTLQALHEEAVNLLFETHSKPPIA